MTTPGDLVIGDGFECEAVVAVANVEYGNGWMFTEDVLRSMAEGIGLYYDEDRKALIWGGYDRIR